MTNKKPPVIGVLLGDAAGIGPEIVAKAAQSGVLTNGATPLIIGDERILRMGMEQARVHFDYAAVKSINGQAPSERISLLEMNSLAGCDISVGAVNPACGRAVAEMIRCSAALFKEGKLDGVCFAPFNKAAIKLAGNNVESELDLFSEALSWTGMKGEMNVVENLWTSRVTGHIPLSKVSRHLTVDAVGKAIRMAHETMVRAGNPAPRIALCALNPHAGESGLCGREEIEVIAPAAETAAKEGICITGIFPADTIFISAFKGSCDAVVTMYHDQGQIALKLKDFQNAVTVEAGLPMPITTPAHGTAYDIAGKGIATLSAFTKAYAIVTSMARRD